MPSLAASDFGAQYARAREVGVDYDEALRSVYRTVLRPGGVAVDVGAHVGKHTIPMAECVGPEGTVYAFEPLPEALEELRERTRTARLEGTIVSSLHALSDKASANATFWRAKNRPGQSGLLQRRYTATNVVPEEMRVTVSTLDREVPHAHVDFVKVDVEGAEELVLRGGERLFARSRPVVAFEFGPMGYEPYGLTAAGMYDWLGERRYTIFDTLGNELDTLERFERSDRTAGAWDYYAAPSEHDLCGAVKHALRLAWSAAIHREKKTAVFFIFQPDELEETRHLLTTLAPQLDANTRAFGVVNGPTSDTSRSLAAPFENVELLFPDENLGVAGGRNLAVDAALDWGADLLVAMDNDIVFGTDYLAKVSAAYWEQRELDPNTGVCMPAVMDYSYLASRLDGRTLYALETYPSDRMRQAVMPQRSADTRRAYHHLGGVNWPAAYLMSPMVKRVLVEADRDKRFHWAVPERLRPYYDASFLNGVPDTARDVVRHGVPVEIDTAPGGVHVLGADVVRRAGPFDEAFNPFGFEDSEFCIRCREAGLRNYLWPNVVVVHDIYQRFSARPAVDAWASRGKMRALFIRGFGGSPVRRALHWTDSSLLQTAWIMRSQPHGMEAGIAYLRALMRHARGG